MTRALSLAVRGMNASKQIDRGPDLPPLCACHHVPMRSNGSGRWRCYPTKAVYRRSYNSRTRVAPASRTEPYTRDEVHERDGGMCRYCDEKVGADWHVAHLVALARGGDDTLDNVAVACAACNLADGIGRLPVQLHLPRAA